MRQAMSVGVGELVIAVLCAVAAIVSWSNGVVRTSFAANGDLPAFEATRYVAPWLVLSAFLAAIAGLFVIDGAARLRRTVHG